MRQGRQRPLAQSVGRETTAAVQPTSLPSFLFTQSRLSRLSLRVSDRQSSKSMSFDFDGKYCPRPPWPRKFVQFRNFIAMAGKGEGERRYRPQVVVRQARRWANCASCCRARGVGARRAPVARCCARRPLLSPSDVPPEVLGGEQVVETASGMLPEEEQRFISLRTSAASSQVSDAFRLEVGRLQAGAGMIA